MTQFARPDADAYVGNFSNQDGAVSNLYQAIDEAVADDSNFVQSPLAPVAEPYVVQLSPLEDPLVTNGHLIHYRYAKSAPGGATLNLAVELRQGYVDEANPGKLIATWNHPNIGSDWQTVAQALTTNQANSITDYTALYLRFVFDQPRG